MISPTAITNYNRTDWELQIFWLFGIMVAGKNSDQTATKLGDMINALPYGVLPFTWFKQNPSLVRGLLASHKIGQYDRIEKAIAQSVDLDLRNATLEQLEDVHGVGPKTVRFFLLHSRKDAKVAVLDTHILKWLGTMNVEVPKQTPSRKLYLSLEAIFLALVAKVFPDKTMAEVDLHLWTQVSGRSA